MCKVGPSYTVRNIKQALELLEELAESPEQLTLPWLAESAGLTCDKTLRLLAALGEKGLVERDPLSGAYQLGRQTAALGRKLIDGSNLTSCPAARMQQVSDSSDLASYAHPILEKLALEHDEAVYMTVLKDDEVLFLNMVDCRRSIRAQTFIGRKIPFFTNAAGKVMKAVDSWDLLEKICKKEQRGDRRPDLNQLAFELEEIRSTGVAVDDGGLGDGIISVAVAVRDYAGQVLGAITLLAPSFRMLAERVEQEIIPSLQEGAELLSARFGYARG
jgi:DNA-binding IclR family transcriptional regulator